MKSISEVFVVSSVVDMMREGHINLDHFLQRESFQWSMKQRIKLIDTLMRGYPFPAIYAIKESDSSNDLTILDGKQRFLTLKAYIIDKAFAFKCYMPVVIDGKEYDIDGCKFDELPDVIKRRILGANFNVITFTGYTVEDIFEIFDRLNNGTPLTKAEKCKPLMGGEMIFRFRRIMDEGFFEKTGLTAVQLRKGNGYMALVQCLMLMKCAGSTRLSSSQISSFLAENSARLTAGDYDELERCISWLSSLANGINLEHCKITLTKMSIAPIIYVLHTIGDDAAALARFKLNLTIFLNREELPAAYLALCTKSTDRAQVEGRVRFFEAMSQPAPEQSTGAAEESAEAEARVDDCAEDANNAAETVDEAAEESVAGEQDAAADSERE